LGLGEFYRANRRKDVRSEENYEGSTWEEESSPLAVRAVCGNEDMADTGQPEEDTEGTEPLGSTPIGADSKNGV
jgi:hypothetical protein